MVMLIKGDVVSVTGTVKYGEEKGEENIFIDLPDGTSFMVKRAQINAVIAHKIEAGMDVSYGIQVLKVVAVSGYQAWCLRKEDNQHFTIATNDLKRRDPDPEDEAPAPAAENEDLPY